MSLIRDEDCCCRISGIISIVSFSLFLTIVCWLVLCVCSIVLSEFLCPLPRPHHFVVVGLVCHTCLSVHTFLCKFTTVERRILNRATSQQISARLKQLVASERRSQHDDIRRPSLEVLTLYLSRNNSESSYSSCVGFPAGPTITRELSLLDFRPF